MTRLFLKWLFVMGAIALVVGTAVSCHNPTNVDESEVYTAVIRQIYRVDDTFGGTFQPPIVYLINTTDDRAGDPAMEQREEQLINEETQQAITAGLADLPAQWVWVDGRDDLPINPDTGEVEGGGAIITLGNIHPQEDGSVQVSGSIYISYLGGGQTYILENIDGTWAVTGNTGVTWIS